MSDVVTIDGVVPPGGLWLGAGDAEPSSPDALAAGRVLDAALRCLGRWGVAKTTIDDIAREAGCSRATVYRAFPGGKDRLMLAAAEREIAVVLADLAQRAAEAMTLEDALVDVLVTGIRAVRDHVVLQYLLEHEPGVVLPYLTFDGVDPLLNVAGAVLSPPLARFLPVPDATAAADWLVRVALSYSIDCDPGTPVDLGDDVDVRRFIRQFGLPGLRGPSGDHHPTQEQGETTDVHH